MDTIEENQELKTKAKIKSLLLRQSFFQASVLLMFFSFLSKALGYVRQMAIAGYFGARYFTDAFFLAQVIPVLGASLVTSALPLVFIPLYISEREKDEKSGERFASSVFWGVVFFVSIFSFLIFFASVPITKLVAPGFSGEQLELTRRFLISLLPLFFFQALAGFFTAYLQAQKHFFSPALAFSLTNIPIILFIIFFAHKMPFQSLVWGFNIGYFIQCITLLPVAIYFGFNPLLSLNFLQPLVKRLLILILPVVIGSSLSYIDMLIARAVASSLGEGIISALNYSYSLMGVPLGLMAGSITVAVFPFMSSKASVDRKALARETMRGLYASWLVALPIGVIFFVLSQPIIRIMFERGAFTPEATKITADMLAFFSLGIPAMTAWQIATRAFYAFQDTITPLKIGFLQIGIDISLLLTLPKLIGYKGLPLATAISISLGFLLLWNALNKELPELKEGKILLAFGKSILMCLSQGLFLFFFHNLFGKGELINLIHALVYTFFIGSVSVAIFLFFGKMLAFPGVELIINRLKQGLNKNP
jgi:putative peptidoglycan lipid II flippase